LPLVTGKITGYILLLSSTGAVKMLSQLNVPEGLGWGFLLCKIVTPCVLLIKMWWWELWWVAYVLVYMVLWIVVSCIRSGLYDGVHCGELHKVWIIWWCGLWWVA